MMTMMMMMMMMMMMESCIVTMIVGLTCGMMVSLERRSWSPIFPIAWSSITMDPAVASMMRNRASVMDDLPAPVRPTIPTCEKKTVFCVPGQPFLCLCEKHNYRVG